MSDDRPDPPFEAVPNLKSLARDIMEIKATLDRNNARYTALESAARRGQRHFWMLVVDLFRRILEYAQAEHHLLAWGAVVPFFPVERALYESVTTLKYISTHATPEFEAQVAFAHEYYHMHRKWVERGSPGDECAFVDSLKATMDGRDLDAAAISEAERRCGKHDWTGLKRLGILEIITGAAAAYAFYSRLSQLSHPHTLVGGYMRDPTPDEAGFLARRVREYLHDAWSHLRHWIPVDLSNTWLDDPGSQP